MNAFRRDRWSASSGGTHSLLGGQFAVYLRLISPYLSPVYRAASISYQRHINFMLTAARINTLFTTKLRLDAFACGPPAGGGCRNSKPPLPCRGGGACGAGDGGVFGVCASYKRTADFRHPSGRTFVRPPPLQVGEALSFCKSAARAKRSRPRPPGCDKEAMGCAPVYRKASNSGAHSASASRRSLVFGQDQRNGVARGSCRGLHPCIPL